MANALQIDTLKLADDLEAARGDPKLTARVIGDTIGTIDISELATKADLKAEIAEVKSDLKAEIAEVKSDLKWMKGIGGAILAVLILPWIADAFRTLGG